MITIFQCEDGLDGIFTGIYEAWASGLGHDNVKVQTEGIRNLELFSRYVEVETDPHKAHKVARTLRSRLSEESYHHIFHAALSEDPERADAIYRVIVMALTQRGGSRIMERLQNPYVCQVFECSRRVGNESHRYLGFLRFQEMKSGLLCSEIHPENRVLPLIGDHFADRFPQENFLIYDGTHQEYLVHPKGRRWFLAQAEKETWQKLGKVSNAEGQFQSMWQCFCETIAVEQRKNPGLQKQLLPLKFREYMTERYD